MQAIGGEFEPRNLHQNLSEYRLVWHGTSFGAKNNAGSNPATQTNSINLAGFINLKTNRQSELLQQRNCRVPRVIVGICAPSEGEKMVRLHLGFIGKSFMDDWHMENGTPTGFRLQAFSGSTPESSTKLSGLSV